jgi:hypothetical protein
MGPYSEFFSPEVFRAHSGALNGHQQTSFHSGYSLDMQEPTDYLGQYFMASRGARLVNSVSL